MECMSICSLSSSSSDRSREGCSSFCRIRRSCETPPAEQFVSLRACVAARYLAIGEVEDGQVQAAGVRRLPVHGHHVAVIIRQSVPHPGTEQGTVRPELITPPSVWPPSTFHFSTPCRYNLETARAWLAPTDSGTATSFSANTCASVQGRGKTPAGSLACVCADTQQQRFASRAVCFPLDGSAAGRARRAL